MISKTVENFARSFRAIFVTSIIATVVAFWARLAYYWWLCCTTGPGPLYLVTADEVNFTAGEKDVQLPKGLVLYPVNEQEKKDDCYPGGQYKIYIDLTADGSKLNTIEWPKTRTNLVHLLKR